MWRYRIQCRQILRKNDTLHPQKTPVPLSPMDLRAPNGMGNPE